MNTKNKRPQFKVRQKVSVTDNKTFVNAPGIIIEVINDTRYSVKVRTSKKGSKSASSIRMRFNENQLSVREDFIRVK